MNETNLELLKLLIQAAVLILAVYVIPSLRKKLISSTDEKTYNIIKSAVYAVQQLYWKDPGEQRKQVCERLVQEMLSNAGISITESQISILIEAAVHEMHIAKGDYKKEKEC